MKLYCMLKESDHISNRICGIVNITIFLEGVFIVVLQSFWVNYRDSSIQGLLLEAESEQNNVCFIFFHLFSLALLMDSSYDSFKRLDCDFALRENEPSLLVHFNFRYWSTLVWVVLCLRHLSSCRPFAARLIYFDLLSHCLCCLCMSLC